MDFLREAIVGALIGAVIAMFIYAAPAIGSFLSSTFTLGYNVTSSGALVAITVTGAQIAAAGAAAAIGLGIVMFSQNADRYGKSKIGSNSYYNKQFNAFWNRYGNGNLDTRRAFHDFITKKGKDAWDDLLKAWEEFLKRRGKKL